MKLWLEYRLRQTLYLPTYAPTPSMDGWRTHALVVPVSGMRLFFFGSHLA